MKKTYLILINILCLLTLAACSSTPKKESVAVEEEPTSREVVIKTYECYGDPNMEPPTTLKAKMHDGTDLNGVMLTCNGDTVIVDTILDYGPDEVNILDVTTGRWKTYAIKDCHIASPQ